jgi:hypothetical protein
MIEESREQPKQEGEMADDSERQTEPDQGTPGDAEARSLGGFAAGVVVGVVLGVGLGMLFAPDRGNATRKRLRKRLAKVRERASDGLETAGKQTRKELARKRRRLDEALERVRER